MPSLPLTLTLTDDQQRALDEEVVRLRVGEPTLTAEQLLDRLLMKLVKQLNDQRTERIRLANQTVLFDAIRTVLQGPTPNVKLAPIGVRVQADGTIVAL